MMSLRRFLCAHPHETFYSLSHNMHFYTRKRLWAICQRIWSCVFLCHHHHHHLIAFIYEIFSLYEKGIFMLEIQIQKVSYFISLLLVLQLASLSLLSIISTVAIFTLIFNQFHSPQGPKQNYRLQTPRPSICQRF